MRVQRSDDELRGVSAHFHYEVWMFLETARLLAGSAALPLVIGNALLESFTIHARAVLQAFYPGQSRSDDVLAADFLDDPDVWETVRPSMSTALSSVAARVGKEVAHLTYARLDVTRDAKGWHFVQIAQDLRAVVAEFLRIAQGKRLSDEWEPLRRELVGV